MGTGLGAKGEVEGALGRLGPRGEMKRARPAAGLSKRRKQAFRPRKEERGREMKILFQISFLFFLFHFQTNFN